MLYFLFGCFLCFLAIKVQEYWYKYSGNLTQSYIVEFLFVLIGIMIGKLLSSYHICML
jgi:ABC-type proline/glycine betaine transport system permease subunit